MISLLCRSLGALLLLTSVQHATAKQLAPNEYLDIIGHTAPTWSLDGDSTSAHANLDQAQTNGKSLLGSVDAPQYNSFIPGKRRQTTVPWGNRTASNTNPHDGPRTGVVRRYNFTVARATLAPDGVETSMILVNGQFPGPTIEANWGDTISVTVTNQIADEGTSMHWHGLLQTNSNFNDGVASITQCPIAPGQSYTYNFVAESYGTTWWHAHYSAQYAAGIYGAIIIHGPTDNAAYDIDLGPVLLSDFYHTPYYSLVKDVMGTDLSKIAPASDNNLINGKGIANCSLAGSNCVSNAGLANFQFTTGKRHRLRLVNAGAESIQKFSIDNHTLTVMAVDFTPVVPYQTDIVTLAIGQRMDVIVTATGKATDSVWMRSTMSACSRTRQPNALAMVCYSKADTTQTPSTTAHVDNTDPCAEAPISQAVPYYSIPISDPETTLELAITVGRNSTGHVLWSVNNSTFRGDYNSPALSSLQSGASAASMPTELNLFDFGDAKSIRVLVNNVSPLAHPMHIHGYDMYVLSANGSAPSSTTRADWDGSITNAANPMRRDTFLLQPNGYMVFQLDAVNPGVWPFHCHIAWHASGGLYANLATQTPSVSSLDYPDEWNGLCESWSSWTSDDLVDQIDSGL